MPGPPSKKASGSSPKRDVAPGLMVMAGVTAGPHFPIGYTHVAGDIGAD